MEEPSAELHGRPLRALPPRWHWSTHLACRASTGQEFTQLNFHPVFISPSSRRHNGPWQPILLQWIPRPSPCLNTACPLCLPSAHHCLPLPALSAFHQVQPGWPPHRGLQTLALVLQDLCTRCSCCPGILYPDGHMACPLPSFRVHSQSSSLRGLPLLS